MTVPGPIARAACPRCGTRLELPYVLLGTAVRCTGCGAEVVAAVPEGEHYPATGTELTFADFEQLVRDAAYRRAVGRLLRGWGYRLEGEREATVIVGEDGPADLLEVHLGIQREAQRQRALYQLAMTLWR